jgi:HK97 family phage major capsid protein
MTRPEIKKMLDTAGAEGRGLSSREVAAVINSIPAEERLARTEILAAVNGPDGPDSAETREAITNTLKYMEMRAVDAADDAARVARENEVRELGVKAGVPLPTKRPMPGSNEGEKFRALMPSHNEYRAATSGLTPGAGGYTLNAEMSKTYVDLLTAKSTFLRALPASNVLSFDSNVLEVPMLVDSTGEDYVAELGTIPSGDMEWDSLTFTAKKLGRIQYASVEILEDSKLDQRNIIGHNLLRDASLRVDADAFTGGLLDEVIGIIAQGTTTTLGAGLVTVKYDDIADACAAIEAVNGTPSVIWTSTDMAAALRKQKASTAGTYLAGNPADSPANTAWGLPVHVTSALPAKTVIVADASRLFFGVRRNASIQISEHAKWDSDQVGFKVTMRIAGVGVAEAESVQVIEAAAA